MKNKIHILAKIFFFAIPYCFNNLIYDVLGSKTIIFKGAILDGFPKFILLFALFMFLFYFVFIIITTFLQRVEKLKLIKFVLLSPFLYLWIITFCYEYFGGKYFQNIIAFFLYIIVFVDQCFFINKIEKLPILDKFIEKHDDPFIKF